MAKRQRWKLALEILFGSADVGELKAALFECDFFLADEFEPFATRTIAIPPVVGSSLTILDYFEWGVLKSKRCYRVLYVGQVLSFSEGCAKENGRMLVTDTSFKVVVEEID